MRSTPLFVSFLVISWIAATEAAFVATALTLGGLAALKGAALVGFKVGRKGGYYRPHYYSYHGRSYGHHGSYHSHHGSTYAGYYKHGYRYGRSVENSPADEGEDLLLSAVGQLDPNGCILKMLCLLQIKEESTRTFEEGILVEMFANSTESLTAYNAAFVYAAEIGSKTKDPLACKKYFPNCPLNDEELSVLLPQAWGCGFDIFEVESGEEQQEEVVNQEMQTEAPSDISLLDLMRDNVSA